MGVDIKSLGAAAQAQVKAELERRARLRQTADTVAAARASPLLPGADSKLERDYYAAYIYPDILAGRVASCELHKRFELFPASDFCGLHLPPAHYTPDFFITYANGAVKVVEVKAAKIRKLQRDYIYRRRLFIELYARPRGWAFAEYIPDTERKCNENFSRNPRNDRGTAESPNP